MSTVSQQVRDLQHMSTAELAERYAALFERPPRVRNRAYLARQVAWKLQERAVGGLSDRARSRLDELVARVDVKLTPSEARPRPSSAKPDARSPLVGTTLIRRWHDQEIRVEVRENGFEWNGVLYRSLSGVARAITGANWNGNLFFGLKHRRTTK